MVGQSAASARVAAGTGWITVTGVALPVVAIAASGMIVVAGTGVAHPAPRDITALARCTVTLYSATASAVVYAAGPSTE